VVLDTATGKVWVYAPDVSGGRDRLRDRLSHCEIAGPITDGKVPKAPPEERSSDNGTETKPAPMVGQDEPNSSDGLSEREIDRILEQAEQQNN
jgi:hypothetical protein